LAGGQILLCVSDAEATRYAWEAGGKGITVRSLGDWLQWLFPLGIALVVLWDGRRKPNTLHMAIGWTVAEIHGAWAFQAGLRWCGIVGVTAVTVACLPGLLRLLAEPVRPTARSLEPPVSRGVRA
jgi:hypothetical protein